MVNIVVLPKVLPFLTLGYAFMDTRQGAFEIPSYKVSNLPLPHFQFLPFI